MLTAKQIEIRKSGIGGSDAGAVLGLNRYKTPVDVWLEKTGQIEPEDISEKDHIIFGNLLEETIAQEYARRNNVKVARVNATLRHPEHNYMLANIDRRVVGMGKGLECKTAGAWLASEWGPSGTDQVPDSYLIQCVHYMIVLGVNEFDLAVLIGGQEYRQYTIQRDPDLVRIVIERESEFWNDYVMTGMPPAPRTANDIEALYPEDTDEIAIASMDIENSIKRLKDVREAIKEIEAEKETLENAIKIVMADRGTLKSATGETLITWKKAKDSQRFDTASFQKANPELYQQFTKTIPGSRRFLVK